MPLHSFETRIVTPALCIRHVIVHIEGFNEEGVPEWYFGHPNGLPSREAIRLCSEADYARITQEAIDVAEAAARRYRTPAKPARICGQYAPTY